MTTITCDYCGKEIERKPSRLAPKKHFCSRKCYMLYRRENDYYNHEQEKETYRKLKTMAEKIKERKVNETLH